MNPHNPPLINAGYEETLDDECKALIALIFTITDDLDGFGKRCGQKMKTLDNNQRKAFWLLLTQQGIDKFELAKSIYKHCAELVLQVYEGKAGDK